MYVYTTSKMHQEDSEPLARILRGTREDAQSPSWRELFIKYSATRTQSGSRLKYVLG